MALGRGSKGLGFLAGRKCLHPGALQTNPRAGREGRESLVEEPGQAPSRRERAGRRTGSFGTRGHGPAAPWSLLLGSRQAVPLAGGLWGSSGGDVEAQTEAASPPKLSLGQGRGLGMLQGVGIPPQAGSRTKGDGEGQGTTARAIWPWHPAACGDNLLPSGAAHGAGLPPCSCCCHPRDPFPSPRSPKTSTLGARWGTASPRALMFLGAPLADHPGWRQRRGEDVSAGPV